tara:strand:+ start:4328 stop:5185 length:858 start_codon:yes stop_codon:yes gene_type:complete
MSKIYSISPTNHGWKYGYGFFSNYRICLEQLIHHHETNGYGTPYIDWSNTTWVEGFNPFDKTTIMGPGNPFDAWFDQTIPVDTDEIEKCIEPPRPDLIDHGRHYFDEPTQLKRQQDIDKLYVKPKQSIINKVDKIFEDEFKDEVVLSIMARGTEYNLHHPMYGIFGVNDYISEISKILEENKDITKLFIVSEDMEYITAISEAFPNSFYIPNVFRRTDETMEYVNRVHCWPNVSTKRENHCKMLGEEVIIQAKLMGRGKYLFGRLSGMLAGAVLWNENLEKVFKI